MHLLYYKKDLCVWWSNMYLLQLPHSYLIIWYGFCHKIPKLLRMKFGEIKAKNPAYSQRAFARRLGLSSGSLSGILSGKRAVSEKKALALAKRLNELGWRVVSGGTDSHLLLVDTWMDGSKNAHGVGGVSGKIAATKLEDNGIICNFNTIPGETRSPFDPSGIRVGTPAMTTRGYKEGDFIKVAQKIDKVLRGVK